jgi:hypothetical protein
LPKTAYRFRVSPIIIAEEDRREWSEVITITTYEAQSIDVGTAALTRDGEGFLTFDKAGIATTAYRYTFGKQIWET